jgi:sialidase-1
MMSRDGGMTWGEHRVLIEPRAGEVSVYSPSFVRLPAGDLLLTYFHYHQIESGKLPRTSGYVQRSTDDGVTWSPRTAVWSDQPLGCASSVVKRMLDGRLIWPITRQTGMLWTDADHCGCCAMVSDDDGHTWRETEVLVELPMRGTMEPHVEQRADGRIMMVMRTQLGCVFESLSDDGGETWSSPQPMPLVAPESCPELLRIPATGDLCLIFNGSRYEAGWSGKRKVGSHYGKRSPLTAVISTDEGHTWSHRRDIAVNPKRVHSNPVAFFTSAGRAIVTWFACPYTADWRMDVRQIDLDTAVMPIEWFYGQ